MARVVIVLIPRRYLEPFRPRPRSSDSLAYIRFAYRIAAWKSAEQIDIHLHLLRHTQLRKVAREKGIEAAMELSGNKSERYIWRYIQASEDEMAEALTDLWD